MVLGLLITALWSAPAVAGPLETRDALERAGELLEMRLDDGRLSREDLLPAIVVSTQPRYEETADWYEAEALAALIGVFGEGTLRLCQACMVPRTQALPGSLVLQTGPVSIDEVVKLDDDNRGDSIPARTAIWMDETANGVSLRIVDLRNSSVRFVQNIDPDLNEYRLSRRSYARSEEFERRARGDSLAQLLVDAALYPNQHIAVEWMDQWGPNNASLSGVSLSVLEPILGIGVAHYQTMPFANILLGGKVSVSVPNALARSFSGGDLGITDLDPLITLTGVVRVPFGRSNYAALATINTNGSVGIGLTLLNIKLIPVVL